MLKKKKVQSGKTSKRGYKAQNSIEKTEFLEKIRIGLQQSKNGQVVSLEQVEKRFKEWFK